MCAMVPERDPYSNGETGQKVRKCYSESNSLIREFKTKKDALNFIKNAPANVTNIRFEKKLAPCLYGGIIPLEYASAECQGRERCCQLIDGL